MLDLKLAVMLLAVQGSHSVLWEELKTPSILCFCLKLMFVFGMISESLSPSVLSLDMSALIFVLFVFCLISIIELFPDYKIKTFRKSFQKDFT